jgi:hypothetical protein
MQAAAIIPASIAYIKSCCIDSLQNIMDNVDDRKNRDSIFYRTLSSIAVLLLGDTFLITCCTVNL